MKICRIMSREEYESLRLGLTLENHTVWKDKDRLSTAKGFCFSQYPYQTVPSAPY